MSEAGVLCQINQFLSLFFMVMVQVVITTEWYVINMPLQVKIFGLYQKIFRLYVLNKKYLTLLLTAAGDDHAAVPRV